MAITISQEKKRQRYLFLALAVVIFGILWVVWLGFSRGKQTAPASLPSTVYAVPEIKIDWQMLDNLRSETFAPFEEISAFNGNFGRKNPFISY